MLESADYYKLKDILSIFIRWRKLAIGSFLAVLIPGILVTLFMPPMFEASALMLVDRQTISPHYAVKPGGMLDTAAVLRNVNREEEVKTIAETIRTRPLIEGAVDELHIDFDSLRRIRDFRKYVQATIDGVVDVVKGTFRELKYLTGFSKRPTAEEQAFSEREKLLEAVGERLAVNAVPDTNIIRASFRSSDPELAQKAINTIVADFVESRQRSDKHAFEHFSQEMKAGEMELHEAEVALANYRDQNATYSFDVQRDLLLQTQNHLRIDIAKAESRQAQKAATLDALRSRKWADPQMQQDISKKLVKAEVELTEAAAELKSLHASFEESQQKLSIINQSTVKLGELERNVVKTKEAYLLRQRNVEQARNTESMNTARLRNVQIVDLASFPLSPIRPRTLLYLGIVLGASLLAAIAVPFVAHLNDTTVSSEYDAANLLDLPLVVRVPLMENPPDLSNNWLSESDPTGKAARENTNDS